MRGNGISGFDMSMQDTPNAVRLHIGIFGKRNSGKSTLLNAITKQKVSTVSPVAGTTTDPVSKAMELARNGQVFYLYNNVKEIYNVARKLRDAMPEVEIGVAHGQMTREDIEDVMLQFT